MGIHQRIVQFNHYVCSQLAMESHDTDRLWYFTSDLIYMFLKSKIFIECKTQRNLTVETFVRIDSLIWMSIYIYAFFWLEIIIYEGLLTFRESLLVLSQLLTPSSSLVTVTWTLLMSLSDAETVVSSAKWTKRIWLEDLCMSLIYKRKSTGLSTCIHTDHTYTFTLVLFHNKYFYIYFCSF